MVARVANVVVGEIVSAAEASDLGPCEIVGLVIPEATSRGLQITVAGFTIFSSRWALPPMYIPLEPVLVTRGDRVECDLSRSIVLFHVSKVV
jgi:hypothetical protein